ncbi:MAG: hypothetical protein M0Z29_07105 [Actinomycetota bacterium]|nr:hypothetical protein [Actinomycetota bacterium]
MNPYVTAGYSAVLVTLAVYAAWLVIKSARLRRAILKAGSTEAGGRA